MAAFDAILDDFELDLGAITELFKIVNLSAAAPNVRVSLANSSTLLLAATFEEFARQLAQELAKEVVGRAKKLGDLPNKFTSTAWTRAIEKLGRARLGEFQTQSSLDNFLNDAYARFTSVHNFCKGDLSQDIYEGLVHNENNLRPSELNSLFKLSGLDDLCKKASEYGELTEYFGSRDSDQTHGQLLVNLNEFISRRNAISHALSSRVSSSPEQIVEDVLMLKAFAKDMVQVLSARIATVV